MHGSTIQHPKVNANLQALKKHLAMFGELSVGGGGCGGDVFMDGVSDDIA